MTFFSSLFPPKINCDVCGKNFKANLREEFDGTGTLRSFTCPHCQTEYPVAFIHTDGRVEDRRRHAH